MTNDYYESIIDEIKLIDTTDLSDDVGEPLSKIIEEQKVYFWIRLYLSEEEQSDIKIGDDIIIRWKPSGEELQTKFIAYGKKNLNKDHDDQIIQYVNEDDNKILALMIDTKLVNYNDEIPFIRTLFKTGFYYDYQFFKREDLVFINKRTNIELEYYDCDF